MSKIEELKKKQSLVELEITDTASKLTDLKQQSVELQEAIDALEAKALLGNLNIGSYYRWKEHAPGEDTYVWIRIMNNDSVSILCDVLAKRYTNNRLSYYEITYKDFTIGEWNCLFAKTLKPNDLIASSEEEFNFARI